MPWHVTEDHADCPSSRPWAVVKDSDGTVEGCHDTKDGALDQLAALYAAEADEELAALAQEVVQLTTHQTTTTEPRLQSEDEDCPPGHHRMDGECMPDTEMNGGPFRAWEGVLALEGVETGDGREFAPGSLEWAEPPLPLLWQRESEPEHKRSVVVGRIDSVERAGSEIRGTGVIDLGSEAGQEVARQLDGEFAGGVSVDVDSVKDNDVELVFPDEADEGEESVEETDEGDLLMLFGPPPDKVVFHRGRLRGATLVALPAFVEARIHLVDDATVEEPTVAASLVGRRNGRRFQAVPVHHTDTSNDPDWDGTSTTDQLPTPMPVSTAEDMYAWMNESAILDGDEIRKTDLRFPHHESPGGPANTTACVGGIGVLNGARGGTLIPDEDRQGVYDHLSQHLLDAGHDPSPLADLDELLAAGAIAVTPTGTWFQDPGLRGPTPWTVLDDGRVYGHLALWGICHTTFADRCVTPPRERDYPYFQLGELKTQEGERLGVGQITFGTGHYAGAGAVPAVQHYDHTGHVAADVACGEDRYGIWVAGALRPGLSEAQVRELRAAKLSGDWRKVGGQLRLVAVLAVNVPGFPVPRMRARFSGEDLLSLTAAGIVTEQRREVYDRARGDGYGTLRVRKVKS